MNKELINRIKNFISMQAGLPEEVITETASLENDLGIYGDDAVEFIIAFGKEFKVDVSKFMAADYFSGEGIDIIGPIIRMFTGTKEKSRKEFTFKHLMKAAIAGKLDEEIINS